MQTALQKINHSDLSAVGRDPAGWGLGNLSGNVNGGPSDHTMDRLFKQAERAPARA